MKSTVHVFFVDVVFYSYKFIQLTVAKFFSRGYFVVARNSYIEGRSVVSAIGYLGSFITSANTYFSGGSIRRYASNKHLIARDSSSQQSL